MLEQFENHEIENLETIFGGDSGRRRIIEGYSSED